MNTYQLAEDFRTVFANVLTAPLTSAVARLNGQNEGEFSAPALVFTATAEPFSSDGKKAHATLTVLVVSHAVDDSAAVHAARLAAVEARLFGPGKAATLAAFELLGHFVTKGGSADTSDAGLDGNKFETPVKLAATMVEL